MIDYIESNLQHTLSKKGYEPLYHAHTNENEYLCAWVKCETVTITKIITIIPFQQYLIEDDYSYSIEDRSFKVAKIDNEFYLIYTLYREDTEEIEINVKTVEALRELLYMFIYTYYSDFDETSVETIRIINTITDSIINELQ